MTADGFDAQLFLGWMSVVSLAMSGIWAWRWKKRGLVAAPMTASFILMAALCWSYRSEWPIAISLILLVLLGLMLVLDVGLRAAAKGETR